MIKTINKSVIDNNQIVTLNENKVTVVSKIGRKVAFKYNFELNELINFHPTFNQSYNIKKFIAQKVHDLKIKWFDFYDPFYQRILDAQMYAVLDILKKNETKI